MIRTALALVLVAGCSTSALAQFRGVSTSVNPYVLPTVPGVSTYSILTVNDPGSTALGVPAGGVAGNGYVMVGVPDGMGAYNTSATSFGLLANQELGSTSGVARAHGGTGAFVSQWSIDRSTSGANAFRVNTGRDLTGLDANGNPQVRLWDPTLNGGAGAYYTPAANASANRFNRFCSGDMPASGLYNPLTGNGSQERFYFAGEETGNEGRNFGWIVGGNDNGLQYQLPRLGRTSVENILVNPYANHDATIAIISNDGPIVNADLTGGGYNFMYVGTRNNTGATAFDRAGLTNGNLYVPTVTVNNVPVTVEHPSFALGTSSFTTSGRFGFANLGNVENSTGAQIVSASAAANGFRFARSEDGAWDTRAGEQNDFYFVTTSSASTQSRLWRMSYDDITNPTAGGTIDMLWQSNQNFSFGPSGLAGTSGTESPNGVRMMDNICIDRHGHILIVEDVGSNNILGRVLMYDIATGQMSVIAQFDPAFFRSGAANFLTIDEEASGIIDAEDILGQGWFLVNAQAHYGIAGERVEGGQFFAIKIPTPGAAGLLGLAGLVASRRRRA